MSNPSTSAWDSDVADFARGGAATEKDNSHMPLRSAEPAGNSAGTGQQQSLTDPWAGTGSAPRDVGTTKTPVSQPRYPDNPYHHERVGPFVSRVTRPGA